MKITTLPSLSLTDFDISPERGFLPANDPLERLSNEPTLEQIRTDLPKFLTARQFRSFIHAHPTVVNSVAEDWRLDEYGCAMRILSFAGHGYVWEDPDRPADHLPLQLSQPWCEVANQLGRPPVLSYASYALHNWRRIDPAKPIQLGNIVLLQNFLGGVDEEWFVLVHIQIEAEAGPALGGLAHAHNAASEDEPEEVLRGLRALAKGQEAMCATLLRMKERCDPYIYYNRVRPYIHGWKNSPALPLGLVYDGVPAYDSRPQQFRGETGAQSSIVPSLDAGLGVPHSQDLLTQYLMEMREYMPPRHRGFLTALEERTDDQGRPPLHGYVRDRKGHNPELWKAFCACVDLLAQFREIHIGYADSYIHQQHQHKSSNPTAVGTGGTPFMTYLNKHLQDTKEFIQ